MMQKAQTVRGQETIQTKLLKVRKELKTSDANKERVMIVIKSADISVGVASAGLEDK
jgi:hypothetical protein